MIKNRKKCTCDKCVGKIKDNQMLHPIYFSNFYTSKNQVVIPGDFIKFEKDGPTNCFIFKINDYKVNLTLTGTYEIIFNINCKNERESYVVINCNGLDIEYTITRNNNNVISGYYLLTITKENTILMLKNSENSYNNLEIECERKNILSSHVIIKKIN